MASVFNRSKFPTFDCKVFISKNGQQVLVAHYSRTIVPTPGQILKIKLFKENAGYPDAVRILSVTEHHDVQEPHVDSGYMIFAEAV